jgi:phosphonatase-like hydrolase
VVGGFELVVFDMAGTTVHDDGAVLECFVAASEAVGLRATREELNDRMGLSKREVFDELARRQHSSPRDAAELRDRGYDAFRRILESTYERMGVAPIRGAEEVFAWLKARAIKVALNTGFYRQVTEIILGKLGWGSIADAVVTVDEVPEGRPAPYLIHTAMQRCRVRSVAAVAVIGDTPSDLLAGRNSGARAVLGVTSGSHSAGSLRRFPSTLLIDSVRDLPGALERIARLDRGRTG